MTIPGIKPWNEESIYSLWESVIYFGQEFKSNPDSLLLMQLLEAMDQLLREIQENDLTVMVEGLKDKFALRELGIQKVITLNKPLYQVVESIPVKEVVILTDLDPEGRRLYSRLYQECCRRRIKVNNRLRNFLRRETSLVHVEGLASYIKNRKNDKNI